MQATCRGIAGLIGVLIVMSQEGYCQTVPQPPAGSYLSITGYPSETWVDNAQFPSYWSIGYGCSSSKSFNVAAVRPLVPTGWPVTACRMIVSSQAVNWININENAYKDGVLVGSTAGFISGGSDINSGGCNALTEFELVFDQPVGFWWRVYHEFGARTDKVWNYPTWYSPDWAYSATDDVTFMLSWSDSYMGNWGATGGTYSYLITAPPPPFTPVPIGSLSVNKAQVREGGYVTLNWSVQ